MDTPNTDEILPPNGHLARADAQETAAAYDTLGPLYDEWVQSVIEDVPFYCSVAAMAVPDGAAHAHVIELGAGSGRITMPLLARGHSVVAVDIAASQLTRLHTAAVAADYDHLLSIACGDLRDVLAAMPAQSADAVIAPFRCLLHVAPAAASVMTEIARVLRPGGVVGFDVFHPPPGTEAALSASWQLRRRVEMPDGMWAIWERAAMDPAAARLRLDVRCDGPSGASRTAQMVLHTPPPHHWRDALEAAGLETMAVHSWFDGEPFDLMAPDSVWLAQRPES